MRRVHSAVFATAFFVSRAITAGSESHRRGCAPAAGQAAVVSVASAPLVVPSVLTAVTR
ncbi:MAG: hypothetical protein IPJ28_11185 [Betaproteobacteria bacterium]|nr:hypothetical protein [Betaproteobacteria bacterium]